MGNLINVTLTREQMDAFMTISDVLEEINVLRIMDLKDDIKRIFIEFQESQECQEMGGEYRKSMTERIFGIIKALGEIEKPLEQGHHLLIGSMALDASQGGDLGKMYLKMVQDHKNEKSQAIA